MLCVRWSNVWGRDGGRFYFEGALTGFWRRHYSRLALIVLSFCRCHRNIEGNRDPSAGVLGCLKGGLRSGVERGCACCFWFFLPIVIFRVSIGFFFTSTYSSLSVGTGWGWRISRSLSLSYSCHCLPGWYQVRI